MSNVGFTMGTIFEMRGSTLGFSLGVVTWKKKYKMIFPKSLLDLGKNFDSRGIDMG